VPTKIAKGSKKAPAKAPKKAPPRAKKAAAPKAAEEASEREDGDEDEDDEEEFRRPAPKKGAAAKGKDGVDTTVVPARRLTPEAKAAVNRMVSEGVPLGEALRRAASWETFVAPVKEEPPRSFMGGGGPRPPRAGGSADSDPVPTLDDEDEAPILDVEE